MGRHSADDDDADTAEAVSAAVDLAPRRGRHASADHADGLADAHPQPVDHVADRRAAPRHDQPQEQRERPESGTRADLRLLRRNSAVGARCIAAVLVSFLLYTLVMVIIGRTDVYLLWIWIPIVLSGVLVGAFLDLAHRADSRAVTTVGGRDDSSHDDR